MEIQEYVDIKKYSTMQIGGQFRYFVVITSISELTSFWTIAQNDVKYKEIPIFILGGGSNIVFSDGVINVIALKIEIKGFEVIKENEEFTDIKIGSGEIWDEIVLKTIEMNLSGFEALSGIPGTVGATPVQNVGAYGSEVKNTILEVEVFNMKENNIKILSNSDCKFAYRDSIFKNEAKGKYIITNVTYRLSKDIPQLPDYPGVKKYLIENNINNITLLGIRKMIIDIRNEKLPNPKEIPNVGSFFKNPIVLNEIVDKIKKDYPSVKFFPIDDKYTKIPAGWLIENAGLKGKSFGKISIYDKNALVFINNGDSTKDDLMKAKNEIVKIVKEKFGITLEQEPEMI